MLAVCACPHTGNRRLLQPPSIVRNFAAESHCGGGKHLSARSISNGDKNPIEFDESIDLKEKF